MFSRRVTYTDAILTVIAALLVVLALQPAARPVSVQAQSDGGNYYIEPGVTRLRKPDGSAQVDGRMVVDLRTGDIWGFPTILANAPYPIDMADTKPVVSKPMYLGKFDLAAMKRP